jgi:hypothetical protein
VSDELGLKVVDLGGMDDDPLRHYRAARMSDGFEIIGNGNHVDAMSLFISEGGSVGAAYELLEPEPDLIRTPRLAAVIEQRTGRVALGGVRISSFAHESEHLVIGPTSVSVGNGLLIATYIGDPRSPSPWAEPSWISVADTLRDQIEQVWGAINQDCRVAIAGKSLSRDARWIVRRHCEQQA